MSNLNEFQERVAEWGIETFPLSTPKTITLHLLKEARELVKALEQWERQQMPVKDDVVWPSVMEEVADVVLLSLHLANRKRFSLFEVIESKFQIAKAREYGEPDEDGVIEHIRDSERRGQ